MGKDDPSLNLKIADVKLDMMPIAINWNQIKKMYLNDPTMVRLTRVIQWGWPEHSKELPDDVKVYFAYRFQLHIVNGIISCRTELWYPVG